MSYVLSGYKRSLSVSVTKTINGVTQAGYPKTYPTATDIANGYFTYNAVNYSIPPNGITDDEFAQLTDIEYNQLLNAFRLYVMSLEDGLDFNTDATNSPEVYDASTCPPGTVVGTTTVEVTTTGEVTTTEIPTTTEEVPTTTVELVNSYIVRTTDTLIDICSEGMTTVYSAAENSWVEGTSIFSNPLLTTPVTTDYIVLVADGVVRNVTAGAIGTVTGDNCGTT